MDFTGKMWTNPLVSPTPSTYHISHLQAPQTIEEVFFRPTLRASLIFIGIIGVCLNSLIIFAVVRRRIVRKRATNVFVASLCSTHILVDMFVLPTVSLPKVASFHEHVTALAIMSYALNLCAITYERYVAVKHALRYREKMYYSLSVKIVLFCWLVSGVSQAIPFLWMESSSAAFIHKVYLVIILVAFLVLPLLYLIFAYSSIYVETASLLKRERLMYGPQQLLDDTVITECSGTALETRAYSPKELDIASCVNTSEISGSARQGPPLHNSRSTRNSSLRRSMSCARSSLRRSRTSNRTGSLHLRAHSTFIRRFLPTEAVKLTAVCATITFTCIITWIPVIYMTFLEVIGRKDLEPEMLKLISAYLVGFNCLLDPLVYGLCMRDIRMTISSVCKRM